jgi:hypothetical protein
MMFTLTAGNNCILCHVFCWLWLYSWHFLRNVLFWCFTIVNLLFCTCNCVCLLFLILLFYIAKPVSLRQIQEFFRLILTLWLSMNSFFKRGHLSYKATMSLYQRSWPLNTGVTVYISSGIHTKPERQYKSEKFLNLA